MIRFGSSIDEIMDRATFEHMSVLAQLSSCIERFQTYYQYEKIEGVERKQIDKIPEKAFREAIANALVHRAWDVRASIKSVCLKIESKSAHLAGSRQELAGKNI